jgi:peptide/nickel transport system substrate-binding protein/oligopeptide transport system substrate-binding protein
VRQALALAIDREKVAAATSAAQATHVANGLLPPGMLGYDPELKGWPCDPARARRLLEGAGFGDGLALDLLHGRGPSGAENKVIIEQLAEIGVTLTDINRDYHDHYLMVAKGEEPEHSLLFRAGWVADFPDPDNFLYILFHSRDLAQMKFRYHSDEFDRLTEKARRSANVLEREKLYRGAEKILLEDCPALFLYHNRAFAARQPWLKGMKLYLTPPPLRESELYLDQ